MLTNGLHLLASSRWIMGVEASLSCSLSLCSRTWEKSAGNDLETSSLFASFPGVKGAVQTPGGEEASFNLASGGLSIRGIDLPGKLGPLVQ